MAASITQINKFINDNIKRYETDSDALQQRVNDFPALSTQNAEVYNVIQGKLSVLYELRTLVGKSDRGITDPADPVPSPTLSTGHPQG